MNKQFLLLLSLIITFYGCSTTQPAAEEEESKPDTEQTEENREPVDFSTLLEPPKDWYHLDEQQTQFRGVSSQRAYETILKDKSPQKEIVVAVIDGGVDSEHEDLKNVMWVNEDEIPDNGKDDDQNGYVDDVHGWNFIGGTDGQNVDDDTFELTRLYRQLHPQFKDVDPTTLSADKKQEYEYYKKIDSAYASEVKKLDQQYSNIQSLEQNMKEADKVLTDHLGGYYDYEDLTELSPGNQQLASAKNVMSFVFENDIDSVVIADQKKQIYEFAKYGYNPEFRTRHIVDDNYEDKTERHYGNNDVAGPDPSHGTHVAGIIAAERDNEIGINGIATNTRIMAIRAVPDGDERDKDVANAIRYAVDNGADIINMSFGKSYSPYKEVVNEAIEYADEKGVLMVHGAGNSAKNSDNNPSYPTDEFDSTLSDSSAKLWITVGATSWKPNEEFVANFSNYGDQTVDVFAPGVDIYSTMPQNEYTFQDGTSMASPVVAGIAALIMAYYPDLTPAQVQQLILKNTEQYSAQEVILPTEGNPEESKKVTFSDLSVSDGVVNLYQALRKAEEMTD